MLHVLIQENRVLDQEQQTDPAHFENTSLIMNISQNGQENKEDPHITTVIDTSCLSGTAFVTTLQNCVAGDRGHLGVA